MNGWTVIESNSQKHRNFQDLIRFRGLIYTFAWRDLSIKYKQTILGVAWAVLRPAITLFAFTLVFGKFAQLPSESGAPYAILVFMGLIPWFFVSNAMSDGSTSLIDNGNLISKIYFPRMVLPISSILSSAADLIIMLVMLFLILLWYGYAPSVNIIALPILVMATLLAALGPALLFSALNVKYRDFRYLVPFAIQLGFYVSPIGYSTSIIEGKYKLIYYLNPMAGLIDAYRWAVINGAEIYTAGVALSALVLIMIFFIGAIVFSKLESKFADII